MVDALRSCRIARGALAAAGLTLGLAASGAADTLEPNDTIETAHGPLADGDPIVSYLGSPGDRDYYVLDAAPGRLLITLTEVPAGADYDLFLVDEGDNILAASDNTGNAPETIDVYVAVESRLWILIEAPFGDFDDGRGYTLTAAFTEPVEPNTPPVVALIAPSGGSVVPGGETFAVTWTASDAEDGAALTVDLDFRPDAQAPWSPIASAIANSGAHSWAVPAVATGAASVRITVTDSGDSTTADSTDSPFSISVEPENTPPAVAVSFPNGGDTLLAGDSVGIAYTAYDAEDGAALAVDLAYSIDGGGTWTGLVTGAPNTGSLPWTVPNRPTAAALVRIEAEDSHGARSSDSSDAVFAIVLPEDPGPGLLAITLGGGLAVASGERVTVPILADHDRPLGAMSLILDYDPEHLVPKAAAPAPRAGPLAASVSMDTPGRVVLELAATQADSVPAGSGALWTVEFAAGFGFAGDEPLTVLELSAEDAAGDTMVADASGGSVAVTAVDPELILAAQGAVALPGDTLHVPLVFHNTVPVAEVAFTLGYDDGLALLALDIGDRGAGMLLDAELTAPGETGVRLAFGDASSLGPGAGGLMVATFAVLEGASGNAEFRVENATAVHPEGFVLPVDGLPATVTGVVALSLSAEIHGRTVHLAWTAATDARHAGFRILAGPGDRPPPRSPWLPAGASSWIDPEPPVPPAGASLAYWIEARDGSGAVQRFGPVAVDAAGFGPLRLALGLPVPNPASGPVEAAVSGAGRSASGRVLDALGRVVRSLPVGSTLVWDGRTDRGTEAPSGLYLLVVRSGDATAVRRMVRISP